MVDSASANSGALLVIAKAPLPGRAKTRLSPPFTPAQAAELARAALQDTLVAVLATPAARRILVLDGKPGDWLPEGVEVIPQREGGLGARLQGAFEDLDGPGLLIGMDTPQVSSSLLTEGLRRLGSPACDAVIGPSSDGGYWAIGLRGPAERVFDGVPMSVPWTAQAQRRRLAALGLSSFELPLLRDVDDHADALAVAADAPRSAFARTLEELRHAPLGSAA